MENYIDYLVEKAFSDGYNFALEEKEFTRADKAAMREIYKATNGFRSMPKGARNLNARDIFRLKDISRGKEGSAFEVFNNETGKAILNKMGLENTSKDIEHLSYKFGNKELQERYRRMYLRKHPEIAKKSENLKKAKELDGYLTKRKFREKDLLSEKRRSISDKAFDKERRLTDELFNRLDKDNDFEKFDKRHNTVSKAAENVRKKAWDDYETNKKVLEDKYGKLEEQIRKRLRNSRKSLNETILENNKQADKAAKNMKKTHNSWIREYLGSKKKLTLEDIKLRDKFKKQTKKRDNAVTHFDKQRKSHTDGTNIWVDKRDSPFVTGHEAGHIRFDRQTGGGNRERIGWKTKVEDLVDEAAASSHSLSRGKILGATPKQLKEGREELEGAFNTYARSFYGDQIKNFLKKYRS